MLFIEKILDGRFQFAARWCTYHFLGLFGAAEEHQRRNVLNVKGITYFAGVVHIHFVYDNFAFVFLGHLFHHGLDAAAWTAPVSVKIHETRSVAFVTKTLFVIEASDALREF